MASASALLNRDLDETVMRLKIEKLRLIRCKKVYSLLQVSSKSLFYFILCGEKI